MKPSKLIATALSATALLTTAALATPTMPTRAAIPDDIQTVCKITVKDANGKLIGQRTTTDHAEGVVSRVLTPAIGPKSMGGPPTNEPTMSL